MLFLPTAASTLTATLLLITTITALPHPQPRPTDDNLATRQTKYDQFDDFWAGWLEEQDRKLGTGGKTGDKKVKRSLSQNWDQNQVHFKKHGDVYADLLEARLKRLGTAD